MYELSALILLVHGYIARKNVFPILNVSEVDRRCVCHQLQGHFYSGIRLKPTSPLFALVNKTMQKAGWNFLFLMFVNAFIFLRHPQRRSCLETLYYVNHVWVLGFIN